MRDPFKGFPDAPGPRLLRAERPRAARRSPQAPPGGAGCGCLCISGSGPPRVCTASDEQVGQGLFRDPARAESALSWFEGARHRSGDSIRPERAPGAGSMAVRPPSLFQTGSVLSPATGRCWPEGVCREVAVRAHAFAVGSSRHGGGRPPPPVLLPPAEHGIIAPAWSGPGRLAQLVEHLVYTERVGGSSPSPPTRPVVFPDTPLRCLHA